MWVSVLTISFPFITGLNEAEESRNKDLDFKEKNKWKFIKSQIVLLPVMKLGENFKSLIFFLPAGIDCITYPFTLFNISFACCHRQKFIVATCELSSEWVIKGNEFGRKKRIRNLSDCFVLLQFL